MAKLFLIIGSILIVAGGAIFCIIMAKNKWDFRKLDTRTYQTTNHTISENFANISIQTTTADILFATTDEDNAKIVCYENQKAYHNVSVENDTLVIQEVNEQKWYDHIGIHFGSPKITIYLPKSVYANLSINLTTGDVVIKDNLTFQDVSISGSTGDIFVDNLKAGNIDIDFTTGDCILNNINCANLKSNGTTGDAVLKNVIVTGDLNVTRTTGDVELERCDAATIYIKVTTGDITGSLLSEKTFITQNTTGDIDVPNSGAGGKCQLTATTGDIEIIIVH